MRKRKKMHWHIDYLAARAVHMRGLPVYTYKNLECRMAGDIDTIADSSVEGFGSSDCGCRSHLFYFTHDPLKNDFFLDLLHRFRHVEAFTE
jgi:sugar fermentation stimulation protein A